MSIEGTRDQILSARESLVQSRGDVERGQQCADDVLARYAVVEGRSEDLYKEGARLESVLARLVEGVFEYRRNIERTAGLEHDLADSATAASNRFSTSGMHGAAARAKLVEALGEEAATASVGPYIDHSQQAAVRAVTVATRANLAEERLRSCMERLERMAYQLGNLGIDGLVYEVDNAHQPADFDPETSMAEVHRNERRVQNANDPAALHEHGIAAGEAFGHAMRSMGDHLGKL